MTLKTLRKRLSNKEAKTLSDKRIVLIGGGTGSFQVLKGLKLYTENVTAIVSMFDSGGSTGTLRDEFGILPPGDLRKCLVALASEDCENDLRRLFIYRFPTECSIHGHSFGNLFITALSKIYGDDIVKATEHAGKILKIKGKIYPVTQDNAHLCAILEDGQEIVGETNIDIPKHDPTLRIKTIKLTKPVHIYEKAKNAILNANTIVLGPGDMYTSILPNLLVDGMKEAIKESKATKIYVCNVMTKSGETSSFCASDFLKEIRKYTEDASLDYMICNSRRFSKTTIRKYKEEGAEPVVIDTENIQGVTLICEDVAQEKDVARHDPKKIARLLMKL